MIYREAGGSGPEAGGEAMLIVDMGRRLRLRRIAGNEPEESREWKTTELSAEKRI